jgi:hypothetical protein
MKALRILAAALLLPALAASCGDVNSPTAVEAPTKGPNASTASGSFYIVCPGSLPVGGSGHCRIYSFSGYPVYSASWFSSNPGVASVSGGFVYGRAPGFARITAFSGGYSSSSSVQVYANQPAVASRVTVTSATVYPGTSAQLTAYVYDQYGNRMSGQTVTWSIDAPWIASIDGNGVVTGQSIGSTTARAAVGSVSGAGTVTVADPNYVEPEPREPMCGDYLC